MDEVQKKKRWVFAHSKERRWTTIALVLSFCSSLFFFSPVDIYLNNQFEFNVLFRYVLLGSLALTAALGVVLLLLLSILPRKAFIVASCLLFGLELAAYVQTLFYNGKMTTLVGGTDSKGIFTTYNIVNYIVYTILLFGPVLLCVARRDFPKVKFLQVGRGKVIAGVSLLVFGMQLTGFVSTVITKKRVEIQPADVFLSYEPTTHVSKENNIVVFLIDRLDGIWMTESLEKYPDLADMLPGFTFYQNNISNYSNTFPAVPQMLTGKMPAEAIERSIALQEVWSGTTVLREIRNQQFHINLSIDHSTTYPNLEILSDQCDNIRPRRSNTSVNLFGEDGIMHVITHISLGRNAPYLFKPNFLKPILPDFSNKFYDDISAELQQPAIGNVTDITMYEYWKNHPFTADSDKPTFNFYHLNGAHDPNAEVSSLYQKTVAYDHYTTIRGSFVILEQYMNELKRLGVYDQTTILIMGDHARVPIEYEVDHIGKLNDVLLTGLLIKPQNAGTAPLQFDTTSQLSNAQFPASIMELVGIDTTAYGDSYFDIIKSGKSVTRELYLSYMMSSPEGLTDKYEVTGDARDFKNWTHIHITKDTTTSTP